MRLDKPKQKYWHCFVRLAGKHQEWSVVNDMTFAQLQKQIVEPWHQQKKFTVGGLVIPSRPEVAEIKIVHTRRSQKQAEAERDAENQASNFIDHLTDPRSLSFDEGEDLTYELLFEEMNSQTSDSDVSKIVHVCKNASDIPHKPFQRESERSRDT
ncbi:MAG: hypothetical protein ABSC01_08910 [Verrucomicrobiota bacterium]|jgi:hypothetical protein